MFNKNLLMSILFLAVFFGLSSMSFAQNAAPNVSNVDFELCHDYLIVVKVKVNNAEEKFLLDTGANQTVVSKHIKVDKLDLPLEAIESLGGKKYADSGMLNRLVLGSHARLMLPVLKMKIDKIQQTCPGVEGVIGNDVLHKFNYSIDYEKKTLGISLDEINVEGAEKLPIVNNQGRMLLNVKTGTGDTKSLVLDSAASNIVMFNDLNIGQKASVLSVADKSDASFSKDSISVGNKSFPDVVIGNISAAGREENGLFSMRLFKRVYISNSSESVSIY